MKWMIAGSLVFFVSTAAQAVDWVVVAQQKIAVNNFKVWEVDAQSITARDGMRNAWVRYTVAPAIKMTDGTGRSFQSTVTLAIYDCLHKETADQQWSMYPQRFGGGHPVASYSESRESALRGMRAVIPGTFGETILSTICAVDLIGR